MRQPDSGRSDEGQRLWRAFLTVIVFSILAVAFTNCADQRSTEGLLGVAPLSCPTCTSSLGSANLARAGLRVNAADPLVIQTGDVGFNVGGSCDDGGYFDNEISWVLTDINGAGGIPSELNNLASCQQGRFFLFVSLPQGFNYSVSHVLNIQMALKDGQGQTQGTVATSIGVVAQ